MRIGETVYGAWKGETALFAGKGAEGGRGWEEEAWEAKGRSWKVDSRNPCELYKYVIDIRAGGWREVDYPETGIQVQGTRAGLEPSLPEPGQENQARPDCIAIFINRYRV